MTNADVNRMLRIADEKGRQDIDRFDIRCFLAANELLQREPTHASAKTIVTNFLTWLNTGKRTISWLEFTLPEALLETEEESAESNRLREKYFAAQAQKNG